MTPEESLEKAARDTFFGPYEDEVICDACLNNERPHTTHYTLKTNDGLTIELIESAQHILLEQGNEAPGIGDS